MRKHHPGNERIKRRYFSFLKEARGQNEASLDATAMALSRFEESTRGRDFKNFHVEQAIAFKKRLDEQRVQRTREPLSRLQPLRQRQPGRNGATRAAVSDGRTDSSRDRVMP